MPGSEGIAPPALDFYRVDPNAPEIVPASPRRAWMDATHQRFAYRCTPMTIANASGWELRCPFAFDVVWDGGDGVEAITVLTQATGPQVEALIASHFGHGILTFHTGWLVRTSPGWATWTRGSPNWPKDGIAPLDGFVETAWLPFTFTMNWRFTRPGRIGFAAGEPFCFMTPVPHSAMDAVRPAVRELADDPALAADYARWQDSRQDFNAKLRRNDNGAVREGWQRSYVRAEEAGLAGVSHLTKRSLKRPARR